MRKLKLLRGIAGLVMTMVAASASANVVLNFASDPDQLKSIESFRADRPGNSHQVPLGSAAWAVLFVDAGFGTIGNFSSGKKIATPQDAKPLHLEVSISNEYQNGFDPLYTIDVPVGVGDAASDHIVVPLLPDSYDQTFPGFDRLIDRILRHKKGIPLQVKVKLTSSEPMYFAQNGIWLDDSKGLGRYRAWIDQREQAAHELDAAKVPGRTRAVRAYRSMRGEPKFEADAKTWWRTHAPGNAFESVKVCSDLVIVRDPLGLPSEKQYCALYTFKRAGSCWTQMRRLSYRRVGTNTYDNQLVDSTFASMQLPVGQEVLVGGNPYEIACK